jgi:hypothetical protein
VLGLFKRAPKLEAHFTPTRAVARELAKEVVVAGELVVRNVGRDAELTDLELVLVAGGTRRIDLPLPDGWAGRQRLPAGGALQATVDWTVELTAPMRASAAEIQLNTTAGGKHTPLARSARFPLESE